MPQFISPKAVIAATVASCVAVAAVVGGMGYQAYDKVRVEAVAEFARANVLATEEVDTLDALLADAEAQITLARELFANSEGKTLDNTARDALAASILAANTAIKRAQTDANSVNQLFLDADETFNEQLIWPENALTFALSLSQQAYSLTEDIESELRNIEEHSVAVQTAMAAWQAEQDRLAAEAAAKAAEEAAKAAAEAAKAAEQRMAKTPTIPSGSTLTPTGGATAPSAPPPPPDAAAQIAEARAETPGFSPNSFMAGFANSSFYDVDYVPGLCRGYYVCGRTLVSNGVKPIIQLDSDAAVMDVYATDVGKYVLVHEVAHVMQYWAYGQSVSGMIAATEPLASASGRLGTDAVEYMADCSTIPRIGYAIAPTRFPYTSSCTTAQYQAGLAIW